ncbi:probable serine/threonine-protein kinase ifkA [Betta splendens]|uniref:Probable serine/threonine-protein kinase ifkA n=1 Tax=Betta splendens TaxID=158456 RepID=A0A6P7N0I6_BETSP|nr:probable serine/threonine-protein kinase ifkA [Betta splendens]XP_029012782.1 probable serine/threonine-protein kinase ifkA [Betta splendens]
MLKAVFVLGCLLGLVLAIPLDSAAKRLERSASSSESDERGMVAPPRMRLPNLTPQQWYDIIMLFQRPTPAPTTTTATTTPTTTSATTTTTTKTPATPVTK